MSARRTVHAPAAFLAAVLLAGSGPAAADWLVTREGARVETRGAWEVRGKLVVFTAPDGTLASVRLETVDLEASRRTTEEARLPKPVPAEPAKRKSVVSITDKDFPKGPPAPAAPPAPADGQAAPAAAPAADRAATRGKVVVETWEQRERPEGDGIEILGVLRNDSTDIATELGLSVSTLDETGTVTAPGVAFLTTTTLPPRGTVNFQVTLPVFTFQSATFDVRSKGLQLQTIDPPAN